MNYSITQFGKPLDESMYTIDEENKIFSSSENYLVLDFRELDYWSFKTGNCCVFKADSECFFNTGGNCTFSTGYGCVFDTGSVCTFDTSWGCEFNIGVDSVISVYIDFKKIKTEGNSIVFIANIKIHTYLEEEMEIYFSKENNEILYTGEKWNKDKYKMMKELRK